MRIRFYHWYNALLAALLGLLGFESCDGADVGADEYGCPWAKYKVRGTVTDETGNPIPSIRIELAYHHEYTDPEGNPQTYHHGLDTVETDEQGKYQTRVVSDNDYPDESLKVIIEDVDGAANGGEFQGDTLAVKDLERTLAKKGEGWYIGLYEMKGDATLKPRTDD